MTPKAGIAVLALWLTIATAIAQTQTRPKPQPLTQLPPFERAVVLIKHYEQWHTQRHYPYIGYGHKIQKGETLTYPITEQQADSILRSDLKKHCARFRRYGADSLLLACVSYNCGSAALLGSKRKPRSTLIRKLDTGNRDILRDLLGFSHYKGRKHPQIQQRRMMEYLLLFEP